MYFVPILYIGVETMIKKGLLAFKLMVTYIGAIVGAGFASGQELMQFFVIFGHRGQVGMLLSGVLFALFGILIVKIVDENNIINYQCFLNIILGKRLGRLVDIWISISIFLGLGIMIAGCATVLKNELGLDYFLGLLISGALVILTIIKGEKGVLNLNALLIPLLIIVTVIVCTYSIFISETTIFQDGYNPLIGRYWFLATILYFSYNIVIGIVILTSINQNVLKDGLIGIPLGGIILGIIGCLMVAAMRKYMPLILTMEIPMIYLTNIAGGKLSVFYAVGMYFAMLTTAVSNGFGLVQRLKNTLQISETFLPVLIVMLCIPITFYGFVNLIGHFYPVFGYVGLLLVFTLLLYFLRDMFMRIK